MTKSKKTIMEIAEEHWTWIDGVLYQQRLIERKLYIDAFVHGYKHGEEARKREVMPI